MYWAAGRLGRALVTLLLLISFTFFALNLTADPALQILGPDAGPEVIEQFRRQWGLDLPMWQQYLHYLRAVLTLDLGDSYRTGQAAVDLVSARLPATLALMIPTAMVSMAIGVPLGIYAATFRGAAGDRLVMILAIFGFAVPNFVVGVLLMYLFSVKLAWIPPSGIVDWRSFIMPIMTMATAEAGVFARFTRSAMVETLDRPMIDTALASGMGRGRIMQVHVLPNAALPLLTVVGLFVGNLIGGAVVTENVFSWPGIGRLLVDSVGARDFTVVQTIVLLIGITMILSNLAVDLSYAWIDPRIRDARRKASRLGRRTAQKGAVA